jgi:drug/metabolite transporter (DMT)-like permease
MTDGLAQWTKDRILGLDRDFVAVVMMACGSSLITLGFIFANERQFHPTMTGLIRGLTALSLSYAIARWKGIDLTYPSFHNFKWQLIRNSIMVLQGLVYAWSQFYLHLPIVVTLYAATPIFAVLWDYWVFGEVINDRQKGWLALAFVGVLLTANGAYLHAVFFGDAQSAKDTYISKDPIMELTAGLTLAVVQFIHGFAVVSTKKAINTNTLHVTYFVGVELLLVNAVLVPTIGYDINYHWPTFWELWEGVFFSGVPLVVGMLGFNGALTISHRYGLVAPFQFAAIVVGYLVSVVRYGEALNWFCMGGTLAIVIGVIFLLRHKDTRTSSRYSSEQV